MSSSLAHTPSGAALCPRQSLFPWLVPSLQQQGAGPSHMNRGPLSTKLPEARRFPLGDQSGVWAWGICLPWSGLHRYGGFPPEQEGTGPTGTRLSRQGTGSVLRLCCHLQWRCLLGPRPHLVVTAAGCHAVLDIGHEGVNEPCIVPHGLTSCVRRAQVPGGGQRQG